MKCKINQFTLLELMVGMTVLSILMLMLFQFLISSQRTLNWSDSMWRIYENSRVVFDLVERDLQACIVSSDPGEEIPFFMGDPDITDPNDALHVSFVSSIDPPDINATSRLCEISYRFHEDTSVGLVDSSNLKYTLYRQVVHNGPTAVADWDFDTNPTWYDNNNIGSPDFQEVVKGIQNFQILYYFNSTVEHSVPAGGETTYEKPTSVRITFDLFDETLLDAPDAVKEKTARNFYKDIALQKF